MKVAFISNRLESRRHQGLILTLEDIFQIDSESSFEEFEHKYGSLKNYQGLILHMGIKRQKDINRIVTKYPDIKLALISYTPKHTYEELEFDKNIIYKDGNILACLDINSTEIINHFTP